MQIYGILLNIRGILLNIRGKTEKNGEFRGILWNFHGKYVENHSFSFLFIPSPPQIIPILCSKTYSLQILLKFLAFFFGGSKFSSYFCQRLQDDSSLSGRATVSPMASSRRLFLCLGKSFFLTGKIIFPNWENRYAQYMAAA
jgi:hypothetical protein